MKARAGSPDALIDLNGLDELKGIELGADGTLEIGAMATYTEIMASSEARARPILGEVCAQIADVQVRNRGTIGGNVCTNDPTNQLPPLLAALGAQFTIAGAGGERTVSSDDFFLGVYLTAVGTGELLTRVTIPAGRNDGFAAVTLGVDGTCIASAAASLNGSVRIALGCVDAVPVVLAPSSAEADAVRAGGARRQPRPAVRCPRLERVPPPSRRGARRPRGRTSPRSRMTHDRAVDHRHDQRHTYEREVEARKLLIHFVRDDLDLTGSHIGCDTGNCGACSLIVDGTLVKSCMMLAVQADGATIESVEGLADGDELNKLQEAFATHHAFSAGTARRGC